MISLIRRALDAKRLTTELEAAEVKITDLRAELSRRLLGPSFGEVAKDFDATPFHNYLMDRVVEDLAPMLEQDDIKFLKTAMKSFEKNSMYSPRMTGAVAYDAANNLYQFEFHAKSMRTLIRAHL